MMRDDGFRPGLDRPSATDGPDEAPDHVVCVHCESVFEALAHSRAWGCAADIVGSAVVGHFGSDVAAGRAFLFTDQGLEDRPASGTICDECISQMLSDGRLIEAAPDHTADTTKALTIH